MSALQTKTTRSQRRLLEIKPVSVAAFVAEKLRGLPERQKARVEQRKEKASKLSAAKARPYSVVKRSFQGGAL